MSCRELAGRVPGKQGAKVPRRRDDWPGVGVRDRSYDPFVRHTRVHLSGRHPLLLRSWSVAALAVLWLLAGLAGALATDEGSGDDETAQLLRDGQAVYEANCVACHQADGRGLAGAFPPVLDNPRVEDSDYVATVIRNGLEGEIVVNGETYNGVMPAFQLLDDGQIEAVTAYIQNGLVAPAAPGADQAAGELAGTELPFVVVVTYAVGFIAFLVVAGLVAAPYVLTRNEEHYFDWPRAWLKATVILLFFTIATVVIPSWVLEWGPVSRASRSLQDILGSGIWFVALALGIWGLWRAQRERII